MSRNIFEQSEYRLEQERNVFLQKYGIAVRTDLQRADEIEYATDTQVLNKPKENYFAMTDMEEPTENIAKRALKEIPFNSLALSNPITASAYLGYKASKTPALRGLYATGISKVRQAGAYLLIEAATGGLTPGSIERPIKEVLDAFDADTPLQDYWNAKQKMVDDFNGKVKIVVDNFLERSGLARTEEDGFWYDLGAGAGSVLISIALLVATRNPYIGAMIFGAAEGQGTYEEAIAAGVTPEKAANLGRANAAWIAATEVIGDKFFSKLLYGKGIMGKFSKKVLDKVKKGKTPGIQGLTATAAGFVKGGSIEAIQEASQNVGSDVISLIGGISEKTAGEIVKDALYAGMLAFILGSVPGGLATYANYRKFIENVSRNLQDAGMDKDVADKIGREVALTATGKEMVDESLKAVSSEINSPLTAEDRDPQKFAKVLTEAQTREIEQESWNVEERVKEQGIAAGVAPEVAEASGKVAQTLVNNIYTLAKITPSEQKNFNISVLKGNQNNQVPFDMRWEGEGETQTADIDFSSLDSVFNSLPKDKAKKLFNAIREDARVRVLLDKAVLFREELLKKAKAKTLKEMRDYMTQEEKTALSNFANELEKTQLKIAKELIEKESDVMFQKGLDMSLQREGGPKPSNKQDIITPVVVENGVPKFEHTSDVRKYILDNLDVLGDVVVKQTGNTIRFNNKNVRRGLKNARNHKNNQFFADSKSAVANALYARFEEADKEHEEVAGQDVYYAAIQIGKGNGAKVYAIQIKADVSLNQKDNVYLYAGHGVRVLEQKNGSRDLGLTPSAATNYSIAEFDEIFKPQNVLFQSGFHGSPHRFNRFDLSKVGTGEGAQAHGYGVYVAKQKETGIYYRTIRNSGQIFYKGQPIEELRSNLEKAKQYSRAALVEDFALKMDHEALDRNYHSAEDLKWFEEEILPDVKQEGSLVEVEIPENDVLLDEQKPFSEQPEKVRLKLESLANTMEYNKLQKAIRTNASGEVLYSVLAEEEGSEKEASEHLNQYGIKGITYYGQQDGRCFVIFDDKAVQIKKTYYQKQEDPRGMVEIDEQAHEAVIRVFENSDPSTIIHELAHIYLTMINNAANVSVDPEFQQLVADINAWLGEPAGENGSYSTEQQETFARAFEGYMAEGKSPNKEMEGIFAKFAQWLAEVYESVKDYLQITPEVRSIFDRLLAPKETIKKSKYVGNSARARELLESIKTGLKNEDALELGEMKALLKTTAARRPKVPKINLLKDLKKYGAEYGNAGQIDKEAYANAGVPDKKGGIGDSPDVWLRDRGYMGFDDTTPETLNEAWQMIQDALDGKEVYRLEDQERVAEIEAYDENLKLVQELFPDLMESANMRRMISELESKGYRVVEQKDIKALEKHLDKLEAKGEKQDVQQMLIMAKRVRKEVIEEIEKRQLAGKDQMLQLLKDAKTTEEITSAVEGILDQVREAWESTNEAKEERRKTDLPKTNWAKKRVQLLSRLNEIVKETDASVVEAQKTLASFFGRMLTEEEAKAKERAERVIKNSNLEGKFIRAMQDAVRDEEHIYPADINKTIARLARSLQRHRLLGEYNVDKFLEEAERIQTKNYKKYIYRKLSELFSRKVFEKVGSAKRLKYSPQAAQFLRDAHKVWNSTIEDAQKEYEEILNSLGNDRDNPPDHFTVLRRTALSLKADPEAQSASVFHDFYETALAAVRGDAMNKRMEVLKRIVDEQNLRLAMEMALDKRKIGKLEEQFLLHGGTDFQTMLSVIFGKVKIQMPESGTGITEIDLREELSPETEQIKAAIFVNEARQKLVNAAMKAYGLKSADQAITQIAELQNDKMEILNYGKRKDEESGAIVARLMDETGKLYTNSKAKKETITKEEIITFWLWDQDHDFVETADGVEDYGLSGRLTRAYGREQLERMFDKLTEQDKSFGRLLQKMLSDLHQKESDVHQRLYGFALPQKAGYFPSVTERIEDSIDYQQQIVNNAKSPSFIKARVKSKMPLQKRVSPTKLVMSHMVRASEFIYEAEKYNMLRRLINNSDISDAFEAKFGEDKGKKLYKKLQDLLVQQGPAQRKAKSELLSLSEKAFNGWVKASLGIKVVTGLKQFASSISFAEKMPAEKWAMWFAEGMANPRKTAEFMHKMSPYIQVRYQSGGVNEAVSRAMTQDSIQPFATRWNNLTNMLLINTRLGDKASLIYGGYPYMKYLIEEEGMSPEAAAREFEKQAVRSMQSNLKANLSMAQANADNLPARIVLAFKNQQMQYLRKVADSYVQYKNGEISAKQFGKVLLLYIILNPLVYTMLSIGWLSDDEEERKRDLFRLAISPITNTLDAYPAIGAITEYGLESVYRLLQEENLAKPRRLGTPMVDDFYRDAGKVVGLINEGDAETMDFMMAFMEFGKYFGLPVGTVGNMIGGAKDIATGKPVRGTLRTVGYTKNRASKITGDNE